MQSKENYSVIIATSTIVKEHHVISATDNLNYSKQSIPKKIKPPFSLPLPPTLFSIFTLIYSYLLLFTQKILL